jgi:hypothetical protein
LAGTMAMGPTSGSGLVRGVIIAILGTALAGCAPKELPDWAVVGPVQSAAVVRTQAPRPVERQDRGPPPHAISTAPEAELLPFTPAWQAREDAHDRRLRRSMRICGNC